MAKCDSKELTDRVSLPHRTKKSLQGNFELERDKWDMYASTEATPETLPVFVWKGDLAHELRYKI